MQDDPHDHSSGHDLDSGQVISPVDSRAAAPAPKSGNVGLGFGVFFVGLVLTIIAGLGHSTSRRR
ncbi:hypothetical protein [Saccharothrix deserti]|uniref:hypothetical protein n=1 Tax=Saccharothrix deserti TaxID=2593674 RepID=UPI00131B4B97|nr:hypothetical protein [Saccharothrix deserti]